MRKSRDESVETTSAEARQRRRLGTIVEAGTHAFAMWGLARTQMQDVAREANSAPGTLYLYAASKNALFDLCLRFGLGSKFSEVDFAALPHQATQDDTERWVRDIGQWETLLPRVREAMDAASSVRELIDGLWVDLHQIRAAVRLVERSAREWPALARIFYEQVRHPLLSRLTEWMNEAIRDGRVSLDGAPELAAWHLLALVSRSAVHRSFDLGRLNVDDEDVRAMTVQMLAQGIEP